MFVVLILLSIVIIEIFWVIMLLFSELRINIKQLEISNILYPKTIHNYTISIGFYFLNHIKILGFTITKEKLEHSKIIKKINMKKFETNIKIDKELVSSLKELKLKVKDLKLKLDLGTEDAVLTSFITFAIATAISILLPHITEMKNASKLYYEINPLYQGKNLFNLSLNCIIYVKMVHIINIIFIYLQKEREEKYERTSNRRSYANSYE